MAHIEWNYDVNGDLVFSGRVSRYAIADLKLDCRDREQLASPCETASDFLLDLELIWRRLEQQYAQRPGDPAAMMAKRR